MADHDYFEIPGVPVAKGRPRFARVGAHVRTFTPQKTQRYEDTVRMMAQAAGVPFREGPVSLSIHAVWPMKGTPLKKGCRPSVPKTSRPDVDNIAKTICDALNGIAWKDDSQVVSLVCTKRHAAQYETAVTKVYISDFKG